VTAAPAGPADPGDGPALEDFVHRWSEEIVANDVERMARFVTHDWVLIDVGGQISADAFHDAVHADTLRHHTMTHEILAIRRVADNVAVIATHGTNTATFRGEPISADEWTTNIVVRTAENWRCVLTQLTPRR
jgi:ketosteroid isomerase-like protein